MKKSDTACRTIRAATTEAQVMKAVSDYLASLDAAEIALVPAGITVLGMSHAEEALHSALDLVHQHVLGIGEGKEAAMMNDITLVFSTAARRLAALARDVT